MLTCGPWRPIRLEIYEARVAEIDIKTTVNDDLDAAEVIIDLVIEGSAADATLSLSYGEANDSSLGSVIARRDDKGSVSTTWKVSKPHLWYPRGYGKQPLYSVRIELINGKRLLYCTSKRFGLRKLELVENGLEDSPGNSFFFRINNIPIFCGGTNWIPADMFTPRINKQKYHELVKLAADGNQIMLRVWGGGIYEEDVLYETCDEIGIMVWQDFNFACGNYPAGHLFLQSVEEEATSNVLRLRHHPCIVLWAGNNEDYQIMETENLEYDPDEEDPQQWLSSSFPARYIYEKLLNNVMKKYGSHTPYRFGSPWGGKNTRDPTQGDIHQWNGMDASIVLT
jgi:beta-mannosidase